MRVTWQEGLFDSLLFSDYDFSKEGIPIAARDFMIQLSLVEKYGA